MENFINLLEENKYTVEKINDSYIADNGKICIVLNITRTFFSTAIVAISFPSSDKDSIKYYYSKKNKIGLMAYFDYFNNCSPFKHIGGIGKYDITLDEFAHLLERANKIVE